MPESFKYTEELQGRDIRLITFEPEGEDKTIRCSLTRVSIDNTSAYNALSYAWGDATQTQEVICNGALCTVTQSLYQALLHIRRHHAATPLWADAICINQKSDLEKTRQVRMMVTSSLNCPFVYEAKGFYLARDIPKS
jgi:Heterokaryon incompatibility protein (HET)